jgi:hypothetical protein
MPNAAAGSVGSSLATARMATGANNNANNVQPNK